MFKLGQRSLQNIEKIDDYLQEIVKKAITLSKSDFGILNNGGLRTAEMQNAIFKKGNSRCDGYKKKSYHQTGKAVDCHFHPWLNEWEIVAAETGLSLFAKQTAGKLKQGPF